MKIFVFLLGYLIKFRQKLRIFRFSLYLHWFFEKQKTKIKLHDIPEAVEKNILHRKIIKDTTKGEPLSVKTYKDVRTKNKNIFHHINKAGEEFQDAMFIYMAQEMVPDTHDYTKLFGIWKGKGSKLDLNMTRYINGKEWDAKFLEALFSERMKP